MHIAYNSGVRVSDKVRAPSGKSGPIPIFRKQMFISSNRTRFPAELFVFVGKDARKEAVVVIKTTFTVAPDGRCSVAEEQAPLVYADEHYGDPATTGVRYESDFVPPKPQPEVFVVGSAMAPQRSVVKEIEVGLLGPGIRKIARVKGDRVWEQRIGGPAISAPKPFDEIPLSFDRAFGGSDHDHPNPAHHGSELRNLIGRGFCLDKKAAIGKSLPNLERPGSEVRAWDDKPDPIGFGVVGRGCTQRISYAGTYDDRWMKTKLPFLPDDFDRRYFQAAQPDQQVTALAPGDRYICERMSRSGRFTVELPPYQVRVRFHFDTRTVLSDSAADTLILEPGANRVMLVWRAVMTLPRKLNRLREVHVGPPPTHVRA